KRPSRRCVGRSQGFTQGDCDVAVAWASRGAGRSLTSRTGVAAARLSGPGNRLATTSARALGATGVRTHNPASRVFGNRAIANVALRSQFASARFHGGFFGSAWPWWWGGLVTWFGPLFWPYVYYDFFDYVFWPYACGGPESRLSHQGPQ